MEILWSATEFISLHDPGPGQIKRLQDARVYLYLWQQAHIGQDPGLKQS